MIKDFWYRYKQVLIPLITFIGLLVFWQMYVIVKQPPRFLLPSPVDIIETIREFGNGWFSHVEFTISATLLGFIAAIVFGVLAAIGIVWSKTLDAAITPILVVLQVVPKVAFAPLLFIWFGIGKHTIVIVTFLVAFFPIVINMTLGLTQIEPELLMLTRCYHMSKFKVLTKIRIPNSIPNFFSGIKVASTLAVIGAIIGEFVGSNVGLGYLVIIANNNLNTPLAMASILIISIFGLILYYLMVLIERFCMPWEEPEPLFQKKEEPIC